LLPTLSLPDALPICAASTNRQLVLRPPSTGTDRKNHTRDRGAPRLRRGATSVGGRGAPRLRRGATSVGGRGAPRLRRGATSVGGRGAPRLRRGATSVGGYGGPFRGPPSLQAQGRLLGRLVGGKEALHAELLERDVVGRAEGRQRREVSQHEVVLAELDRQERRRRGVEVQRAPLARRVRIREQLLEQRARLGVRE